MPIPLTSATLGALSQAGVAVPAYERRAIAPRIVHVGVGGFHRAHQAAYLDELATAGSDWRILGVGPLPGDAAMTAALRPQDWLYTLVERGPAGATTRIIGSIVDYRLGGDDLAALPDAVARPETSIVSLTITESGYGDAGGGRVAVFDAIAAGAEQRMAAGGAPVTLLSCDNILHNGDVARDALLRAAAVRPRAVSNWLDHEWRFPNAMVDRITPATTDADRQWLRDEHGIDDRWPVLTETFRQWVIEDDFASGRPALEDVGVLFTDEVGAWETYKLRMLNATHSALAYLAALAGIRWVDEALAIPSLRGLVERFLRDEVVPTLEAIPDHPPAAYAALVLDRFSHGGVRDQVARLCLDGTTKMATFLIPTLVEQVSRGGPVRASATALAGWAHYLATLPPEDQAHDPFGDEARRYALDATREPTRFLAFGRVFPPAVARDPTFRAEFANRLRSIAAIGPLETAALA